MKHCVLTLLSVLLMSVAFAQDNSFQLEKLQSYKDSQSITDLLAAKKTIDEAVNAKESQNSAAWIAHMSVYTELANAFDKIPEEEQKNIKEDVLKTAYKSLEKAFSLGEDFSFNNSMIQAVYQLKTASNNRAGKSWTDADYNGANGHYEFAMSVNELERNNMPNAAMDTIYMYMSAYSANMAENKAKAKPLYEKLVKMGYKMPNVYDDLAAIYTAEGNEEKAKEIISKKDLLIAK